MMSAPIVGLQPASIDIPRPPVPSIVNVLPASRRASPAPLNARLLIEKSAPNAVVAALVKTTSTERPGVPNTNPDRPPRDQFDCPFANGVVQSPPPAPLHSNVPVEGASVSCTAVSLVSNANVWPSGIAPCMVPNWKFALPKPPCAALSSVYEPEPVGSTDSCRSTVVTLAPNCARPETLR